MRCPSCQAGAQVPPTVVHGNLRVQPIGAIEFPYEIGRLHDNSTPIWIEAGALWRQGRLGPERIGGVLANQTRAWASDKLDRKSVV